MGKRRKIKNMVVFSFILSGLIAYSSSAYAQAIQEVPFSFISFTETELDFHDFADDNNTGSVALGFSVELGGQTFDHFDMNSNGYIELLSGAGDAPVNFGFNYIDNLTGSCDPLDPNCGDTSSTYLLGAYDDLSSATNGFYGYKLNTSSAVFYYLTETFADEGLALLNNYEIILNENGTVRWNFNYADFSGWNSVDYYDLFSGLYLGNTQELFEITRNDIPAGKSYAYPVPEPASFILFGLGIAGLFLIKRK